LVYIVPMTTNSCRTFPVPIILFFFICFLGCKKDPADAGGFASVPATKRVEPGFIDEASGMADSKANPGYLWIQQDGGNSNDITLLSYAATVIKKINILSAVNRDWEDMAISSGPLAGTNYIYIADIGDNNKVFSEYAVYRFPEPLAATDTVSTYDKIRFRYPDGPHDAEAMLIDPSSNDIYIITKQDSASRIYRLGYPQNTATLNTAVYSGSLSFNGVVGAASPVAGDEWLLKTYTSLYYWKKAANESMEQALHKNPVQLGYQQEPQGEALCFRNDNTGFYTLSERPATVSSVNLNFYQRK
jgi:hypothetical protein